MRDSIVEVNDPLLSGVLYEAQVFIEGNSRAETGHFRLIQALYAKLDGAYLRYLQQVSGDEGGDEVSDLLERHKPLKRANCARFLKELKRILSEQKIDVSTSRS